MLRPLALLLLLLPLAGRAQGLPFVHFQDFLDSLTAVAAIPDAVERNERVGALWAALRAESRIPFTEGDSAAFLWRGAATTVAVAGDHNGWNPSAGAMSRVGLSDVWMRTYAFPEAARLDYKLVVNGSWILDPNNPHQQWSGFGPNSELRMPAWVFPEETVRRPEVPPGAFTANLVLNSASLGYAVHYRVYTPAGYGDGLTDLPAIYVTDGHEYADDRLGALRIVLDNLIADGRAAPSVVVFVDPREVGNPNNNRRAELYVQNPAFAAFVADELVPAVDAAYRTRPDREARVMLGTSLGGLFSAYLGLRHPDTFGRPAMQSPAFWVSESADWWSGPSIYEMMADAPDGLFTAYMSAGTINDTADEARRMRDVMEANGHALTYHEVPEGHSWGNWRALLDEVLTALVPGPSVGTDEAPPDDAQGFRLDAAPNPSRGAAALGFTLAAPAEVRLACYDALGRLVARVCDGEALAAGAHRRPVALPGAGAFVCRLTVEGQTATRVVAVAR